MGIPSWQRSPGTHPGDVRQTESVMPPEELLARLEHVAAELQNGIIFSVRGERALADMCSGGDYDGDEFVVMRASDKIDASVPGAAPISLVEAFHHESQPWVEPPKEGAPRAAPKVHLRDHRQTNKLLMNHYFDCDAAGGIIGRAANLIQVAQEHWGCAHPDTLKLVDVYNTALDAAKQGYRLAFPEDLQEALYRKGMPCFMIVKASANLLMLPDGSSNSALGRLWCKREQLQLPSIDDAVCTDPDLDFGLPKCAVCGLECGAEELSMHTRMCRRLYELQHPRQSPPAVAHGTEWGAVRRGFYEKWQPLIVEANRELSKLWQRSYGSAASAGARRKYDAAHAHAKLAVFEKYRQRLLESYDEGERERPAHMLLCEASHVYQAAYAHASQGNKQVLELAWQIAGWYLVLIKHSREQHASRPGMAPRGLVTTAQLPRILARRGQLSRELAAETLDVVDVDGGGIDDGEELISTPWSRCV